jgi:hypothetical protein
MPRWNRSQFETEAKKVTASFLADQSQTTTLTDLVEKSAKENCLLPEQINTLAQCVNTQMFRETMDKMATLPDRYVDFDAADATTVIAHMFQDTSESTKTAAELYPEINDEMRVHKEPILPPEQDTIEKSAAELDDLLGPKENPEKLYRRYEKIANELSIQQQQLAIRYENVLGQLKLAFKKIYFDKLAFERNALTEFGMNAVPELNYLRKERKEPPIITNQEKIANLQNRSLKVNNSEITLLKTALDCRSEFLAKREAVKLAVERKDHYYQQIFQRTTHDTNR